MKGLSGSAHTTPLRLPVSGPGQLIVILVFWPRFPGAAYLILSDSIPTQNSFFLDAVTKAFVKKTDIKNSCTPSLRK